MKQLAAGLVLLFAFLNAFGKTFVLSKPDYFKKFAAQGIVVADSDSISGKGSLKVNARTLFDPKITGWNFSIVHDPQGPNEYRYLLFAWKQKGGKSMMIQLANGEQWNSALSYTAGSPGNCLYKIQLSPRPANDWVIVIRDLYSDMIYAQMIRNYQHNMKIDGLTVTGIALNPWDGDYALFDTMVLGTDRKELEDLASSIRKKSGKDCADPLMDLKNSFIENNTANSDWEATISEYGKHARDLDDAGKGFLSEDAAMASAWLGLEKFSLGNYQEAARYLKDAAGYLKTAGLESTHWNLDYLTDLLAKRKILGDIEPDFSQKVALVLVPEIHAPGLDLSSSKGDTRRFNVEWGVIKRFIEAYSGGCLSIDCRFYEHKGYYSALTSNGSVSPSASSIKPYPSRLLYNLSASNDVIALYAPGIMGSYGGYGSVSVIPGKFDVIGRGTLFLSQGLYNPDDFMLPLHEYVHAMEFRFGLKTTHIFRTWPEFSSRPVRTELSYYQALFSTNFPGMIKDNFKKGNGRGWAIFDWSSENPVRLAPSEFEKMLVDNGAGE